MNIIETEVKDVYIIEPQVFGGRKKSCVFES